MIVSKCKWGSIMDKKIKELRKINDKIKKIYSEKNLNFEQLENLTKKRNKILIKLVDQVSVNTYQKN